MRVLTCLKLTRAAESPHDLAAGRLTWSGPPRQGLGAWDEQALETALGLKDLGLAQEVWALSLGPQGCQTILQRALGMGADQAAHLTLPEEPSPRPLAIASYIAAWARPRAFDLVLCGVMSEDAMQGMVGPMLARLLGLPLVTAVVDLKVQGERLEAEREMEGGLRQRLELPLPALLSVQSSGRQARYPALSSLLKAKKTPPQQWPAAELAQPEEREQPAGWRQPQASRAGLRLSGTVEDQAAALLEILKQKALL